MDNRAIHLQNDAKIQEIAIRYIRRAIGDRATYPYESLGELHPALVERLPLFDGEIVLVSAFFSDESWYVFTTRRIVSRFQGKLESLDPSHGIEADFPNFKGYDRNDENCEKPGAIPRDVFTITASDSGAVIRIEYQTFHGGTLPASAVRYWQIKHPILHKLMANAEREANATRNE
jgi:hypothetical protein